MWRANGEKKMLESKKPSQLIKKLHTNEIELKVHLLDDSSHVFNVKVSDFRNLGCLHGNTAPCPICEHITSRTTNEL